MITIADWDASELNTGCCSVSYDKRLKPGYGLKRYWAKKMLSNGLRAKVALNEYRQTIGMVEYTPIQVAPAEGVGFYFIHSIWVEGVSSPTRNLSWKGIGAALLSACEKDALDHGAKGVVAWGWKPPHRMRYTWFKRQGYRVADKRENRILVWKSLSDDAEAPSWLRGDVPTYFSPELPVITVYVSGQCLIMNHRFLQLRQIAAEFGDEVQFNGVATLDKQAMRRCCTMDASFIDGERLPDCVILSDEELRKLVKKALKKRG
ncbi:hypothetical protein KQI63_00030 [bacterium]|nr:hypothetical protein [bacterium]